jgi:hypothetical protein
MSRSSHSWKVWTESAETVTQISQTLGYSDGIASLQLHDGAAGDTNPDGLNHPLLWFPMSEADR